MKTKTMKTTARTLFLHASSIALAAALVACGGGSDGGSSSAGGGTTPASLTVGGTAAVGAALAAAPVSIKCVGGTGTATTAADGSFSVAISGASLPCVLSVTSGTTTLRSVAEAGSASSVTANITPLSEIIVSRLAGGDAAALFNNFDAAAQAKLSSTALSDARAVVVAALKDAIDLSGVDPIKDPLVAANSGKTGNALDQKLDSLGAVLKAGQTNLGEVVAALAANPTAPAVVQNLLKPAASSCAALRSGKVYMLDPYEYDLTPDKIPVSTVDAVALTYTNEDGGVFKLVPVADSPCAFTVQGEEVQLYVAKSGVILARTKDDAGTMRAALGVPVQNVPLAELSGNWNVTGYMADTYGATPAPFFSTYAIDGAGKVTGGADCKGLDACVAWTPQPGEAFTVHTAGGFVTSDSEGSGRLFPVKNAAGQMALLGIAFDANKRPLGVAIFSRPTALSLPSVDQVDNFWDMQITGNGIAQAVGDNQTKIQSVDAATNSYKRIRTSDGRVDGFTVNKPRDGLRYRPAGSSVGINGATITYGATLNTPLAGLGLTVYSSLGPNVFFGVSVAKP